MDKIMIACDLDNTLIHSYKKRQAGDVCVELYLDRQQSFMGEDAYNRLKMIREEAFFLPLTTRSVEQFRRIKLEEDEAYALVANGAVLLKNGERDRKWELESKELISGFAKELDRTLALLGEDEIIEKSRIVDESFVFALCPEGSDAASLAEGYAGRTSLTAQSTGRKMYFFPPELNKGKALERAREFFRPVYVIAAGDSLIDIPMLEAADLALCRVSVADMVKNRNKRSFSDEEELTDIILEQIREL